MFCFQVLCIYFAAFMTLSASFDKDKEPYHRNQCGPYGFRCKNRNTLEFCSFSVDGYADETEMFDCESGYYCDEENASFCTPWNSGLGNDIYRWTLKRRQSPKDVDYDDYEEDTKARYGRSADTERNDSSEASADGDLVGSTTVSQEYEEDRDYSALSSTGSPPFSCQSYGFFPDAYNASYFWYCDLPENGEGFLQRHMICGHDRIFDKVMNNCLLKETIRKDRQYSADNMPNLNCAEKKPGKYADESDCQIYYLCLPSQFHPAVQLTFRCPRDTAYDLTGQSCTTTALSRCQRKVDAPAQSKINCRSPTRFRSVDECSSYFLCFVDNVIEIKCPKFYKFDDAALECLPEKIADCRAL